MHDILYYVVGTLIAFLSVGTVLFIFKICGEQRDDLNKLKTRLLHRKLQSVSDIFLNYFSTVPVSQDTFSLLWVDLANELEINPGLMRPDDQLDTYQIPCAILYYDAYERIDSYLEDRIGYDNYNHYMDWDSPTTICEVINMVVEFGNADLIQSAHGYGKFTKFTNVIVVVVVSGSLLLFIGLLVCLWLDL